MINVAAGVASVAGLSLFALWKSDPYNVKREWPTEEYDVLAEGLMMRHIRYKESGKEFAQYTDNSCSGYPYCILKGEILPWNVHNQEQVYGKKKPVDVNAIYADRNRAVQLAATLASRADMEAGVRDGTADSDWPVVAIRLGASGGEVAWHVPRTELVTKKRYPHAWDGHTDEEKARRILKFVEQHS